MNHDITHCSEKDCPKAETCIRYLAYLELRKYPGKFGDYHSFTIVRRKPCRIYWEDIDGQARKELNSSNYEQK